MIRESKDQVQAVRTASTKNKITRFAVDRAQITRLQASKMTVTIFRDTIMTVRSDSTITELVRIETDTASAILSDRDEEVVYGM
jgi:hypothetical protein